MKEYGRPKNLRILRIRKFGTLVSIIYYVPFV
jgi:hypothetical protein